MENMENIEKQLLDINNEINLLKEKRQTLLEKKSDLIKNSQTIFFKILCTPSKSNHVTHQVGLFKSAEEAKKYIGNGSSYDDDDRCTWNYHVVTCLSNELKDHEFLKMGKESLPLSFPYSGW